MAVHVSEAEAIREIAGLLARVRAGEEIVIDRGTAPMAVLRPAAQQHGRFLSESIALARQHAQELGSSPSMDAEFVADMEEILRNRKPRSSVWD